MNADQFTAVLAERFPVIAGKLRRERHQIYNQMSIFKDYTQQAIDYRDFATAVRCFKIADEVITSSRVRRDLMTALFVSYLEHINLSGPCEKKLQSLMTPKLLNGFLEMHDMKNKCRDALSTNFRRGLYIRLLERYRKNAAEQGAAANP